MPSIGPVDFQRTDEANFVGPSGGGRTLITRFRIERPSHWTTLEWSLIQVRRYEFLAEVGAPFLRDRDVVHEEPETLGFLDFEWERDS